MDGYEGKSHGIFKAQYLYTLASQAVEFMQVTLVLKAVGVNKFKGDVCGAV